MKNRYLGIALAIVAAILYSLSTPFSKLLLTEIGPVSMASFLYLGAGIGVGILYLFHFRKEKKEERLSKGDTPYVIAMTLLDIAAPILMMIGISLGSSSSSSLLNNFEIVATALVALLLFKEKISPYLWLGIIFIVSGSVILSFDFSNGISFSFGSLFVLLATICWGFENNCTRKISTKSSYQIVIIKGFGSGGVSLIIALLMGERVNNFLYVVYALLLGFLAYGLSIFTYIKAQKYLGAAKTSAFYAIAPFIGSFLAFVVVGESLHFTYWIALLVMVIGVAFVTVDTLKRAHSHGHYHTVTHIHDGVKHTHRVYHEHEHTHIANGHIHHHHHSQEELEELLKSQHS